MNMLIHDLVIERVEFDDTTRDEYNQPTSSTSDTDVRGLVQPRIGQSGSANEQEDTRSAGSEISEHTIFLPAGTDIRGADFILQGDRRYAVMGIRRYEYGSLAHLEVDARLVTPTPSAGS